MKVRAEAKPVDLIIARPRLADWIELTKPRIASMALLATLAGFYLASAGPLDYWLAFHTLAGTALVAAGASALNQLLERDRDLRMVRTQNRPLPAARISLPEAVSFSAITAVVGILWLALTTTPLATLLGLLTLVLYAFVYTPLKPLTTHNTLVGAVPGAMPPLIGWAAVTGSLSWGALAVFAILYVWQIPHFMAIAWLYREDYARGGFKMLPVLDPTGDRTARQVLFQSAILLGVSVMPTFLGLTGLLYLIGAVLLGLGFAAAGMLLAYRRTDADARVLLLASVIYLPLLLGLMVADKL
jgi:heme o synthase